MSEEDRRLEELKDRLRPRLDVAILPQIDRAHNTYEHLIGESLRLDILPRFLDPRDMGPEWARDLSDDEEERLKEELVAWARSRFRRARFLWEEEDNDE